MTFTKSAIKSSVNVTLMFPQKKKKIVTLMCNALIQAHVYLTSNILND